MTIKTVAQDAGVSVAAVSKVLRDAYGVSDSLRAKVNESIERLGYRPRTAARGMRGRTYAVGVVMGDLHNPFLPDIVDGIQSQLSETNYRALIGVGQYTTHIETRIIDTMIDHQMDGVVLIAPRLPSDVIERFARITPTAVIAHHAGGASLFDTVNADDHAGARRIVGHLVARGQRNIAMLSVEVRNEASSVVVQREAGYRNAMEAAGLAEYVRVVRIPNRLDRSPGDFMPILEASPRPEAIFCWSDLDAVHLLGAARLARLAVPEELSIVGFDNSNVATLPQIRLSSVDQFGQVLGSRAAQILLERIEGRSEARHELVEPRLVLRESTR